jgi:hypothetical protein
VQHILDDRTIVRQKLWPISKDPHLADKRQIFGDAAKRIEDFLIAMLAVAKEIDDVEWRAGGAGNTRAIVLPAQ